MDPSKKIQRYHKLFMALASGDNDARAELDTLESTMSPEERFDAYYAVGFFDDDDLQKPAFQGKSKAEILELIHNLTQKLKEVTTVITEKVESLEPSALRILQNTISLADRLDRLETASLIMKHEENFPPGHPTKTMQ